MPEILTEKLIEKILYCLKAKKSIYDCDKCLLSGECGNGKVVQSLAQTALTLYEILKRLEWSDGTDIKHQVYCPVCGYNKRNGHSADCELGNLIKGMEASQ